MLRRNLHIIYKLSLRETNKNIITSNSTHYNISRQCSTNEEVQKKVSKVTRNEDPDTFGTLHSSSNFHEDGYNKLSKINHKKLKDRNGPSVEDDGFKKLSIISSKRDNGTVDKLYVPLLKTEEDKNVVKVIQKDADTFGTFSTSTIVQDVVDEGDIIEEKFLDNPPANKRLSTTGYAELIKGFIAKRQIKEAIDVLEIRMIQEDRVKPENYIYNLLLGACGRVGYTKKAFHLFNQMKKRGLLPTGGTYTALFNACANSPWPEDGLSRAKKLKELMVEKGFQPNDTTCNAMIKAFGRCGDIQTAFAIVDDMVQKKIPVRTEVVNFLLQSCISNKDVGFLHALLVWRKFQQNRISPDIYSFNLMLHCVRECELGDPEVANNLLEGLEVDAMLNKNKPRNQRQIKLNESPKSLPILDITDSNESKNSKNENILHLNDKKYGGSSVSIELVNNKNPNNIELYSSTPNLIADIPHLGNMIKLDEVKSPEQRLLLIGGCSGFLKNMENSNTPPNIKTFSILLDNIPPTITAENALLTAMKKAKIKPDIDFLNMLIKKRSLRFHYKEAKEVLDIFDQYKYRPNIFTYGVLALGCETLEESQMLLKEMLDSGYRVNNEILGALVRQACVKQNFVYVLDIMELVVKERINPNKRFLAHLEKFHKDCMEKAKKEEKKGSFWTKGFHLFRMRYKSWLQDIQPDKTEEAHPWTQFRNPVDTKVKNYKNPTVHFKPRISSRYKQKTGALK